MIIWWDVSFGLTMKRTNKWADWQTIKHTWQWSRSWFTPGCWLLIIYWLCITVWAIVCCFFLFFSLFCATPTILDSDKTDDKHQACVLEAVILDRMISAMRKVTIKQQIILIKHAFYHCACRWVLTIACMCRFILSVFAEFVWYSFVTVCGLLSGETKPG